MFPPASLSRSPGCGIGSAAIACSDDRAQPAAVSGAGAGAAGAGAQCRRAAAPLRAGADRGRDSGRRAARADPAGTGVPGAARPAVSPRHRAAQHAGRGLLVRGAVPAAGDRPARRRQRRLAGARPGPADRDHRRAGAAAGGLGALLPAARPGAGRPRPAPDLRSVSGHHHGDQCNGDHRPRAARPRPGQERPGAGDAVRLRGQRRARLGGVQPGIGGSPPARR